MNSQNFQFLLQLSQKMIDLMFLTKLPKEFLTEDKKVAKFLQKEATQPIPKNSRVYFSCRQYDWRGQPVKNLVNVLYKEADNCDGLTIAIRSMGKSEKAWFKVQEDYLAGKEGHKLLTEVPKQGSYFYITIDDYKLKVDDTSTIEERLDFYNCNKALADEAYRKASFLDAAKGYNLCINIFSGLPKKLQRTAATDQFIKKSLTTCKRNFTLSVVKGELSSDYDTARERITSLLTEDRSAKNLYIYGKLLIQMKYLSDARKILMESNKLENNPQTLKLIEKIQNNGQKQKIVCQHIINNLQKERIEESKKKKREAKDEWFMKADKEEEKRLLIQKAIVDHELDPKKLGLLQEDWRFEFK